MFTEIQQRLLLLIGQSMSGGHLQGQLEQTRSVAGHLCHIPKIELLFPWREAKHGFWVVSKDCVIIKQTNTLNQIIVFELQMNFKSKTWIKAMQGEKKEREREKKGKNRVGMQSWLV